MPGGYGARRPFCWRSPEQEVSSPRSSSLKSGVPRGKNVLAPVTDPAGKGVLRGTRGLEGRAGLVSGGGCERPFWAEGSCGGSSRALQCCWERLELPSTVCLMRPVACLAPGLGGPGGPDLRS